MSAEKLFHKAGLADGLASEIETDTLNSGGHDHDTKTDRTDLRTQSEACLLNFDKVAQLAKFYAAGTPPDEEFRAIKEWATAASNELPDRDNRAHFAPKERRTGQEIRPSGFTHAFKQRTEIVPEESDFSAGLQALESSIRVSAHPSGFKYDGFVSAREFMRGRISRTVALVLFAALIGLTFGWYSHREEAKEIVRRWALSVDPLLSVSRRESSPATATSTELLRREAVAPQVAAARHNAEQLGAYQQQTYADAATTQGVERSKRSSPPLHSRAKTHSDAGAGDETDNH
jgi:hypothetical protein